MTKEARKEYMQEYRKTNRERIKASVQESKRQEYLDSIKGDVSAVIDWMKTHKMGRGWYPIEGRWSKKKRNPVVILHCPDDSFPYCVQYAGNGTYFPTLEGAQTYAETK